MAKKDIYKIDNYFITIGTVFLIFGLVTIFFDPRTYNEVSILKKGTELAGGGNQETYSFDDKKGRSLEEIRIETNADEVTEIGMPWKRIIIGVNGLLLLVIGNVYRKREKKIVAIWNALEHSGEAKVDDLASSLGLNRNFITKHLKEINAQQSTFYIWDEANDKIIDSRLKTEFLIVVDCRSCGCKLNEKVSIDVLSPPACEYCGSAVASADELNQMKKELLLRRDTISKVVKKEFNAAVFVALLILFWPGAIFYVVKYKT